MSDAGTLSPPHRETLAALARAIETFAEMLPQARGDEAVPCCPGWNTRELALHLGSVHRWAAAIVLSGEMPSDEPDPLARGELSQWYAGTGAALVAALRAVDPEEPTPNFARVNENAAFWSRRQLHETTIHTIDLGQALHSRDYRAVTIAPPLAADGIDELITVFFRRLAARGSAPDVPARVRISAVDTGDSWIIGPGIGAEDGAGPKAGAGMNPAPVLLFRDFEGSGSTIASPPAPVTEASIEGDAVDLYLGLWGRASHSSLRIAGEAAEALLAGPTSV